MDKKALIPPGLTYLADNITSRHNILGASKGAGARWAKDISFSEETETIFFAGCGYQYTSQLESLMSLIRKIDKSAISTEMTMSLAGFQKKLGIDAKGTGRVVIRVIDPRKKKIDVRPTASKNISIASSSGQLYLQVGAFTDHKNATQLLSRLVAATNENVLINRKSTGDQDVYRVRIGPLKSESEANLLSNRLGPLGISAPHVIVE